MDASKRRTDQGLQTGRDGCARGIRGGWRPWTRFRASAWPLCVREMDGGPRRILPCDVQSLPVAGEDTAEEVAGIPATKGSVVFGPRGYFRHRRRRLRKLILRLKEHGRAVRR